MHLLHALGVHDQPVDNHVRRGRLCRLVDRRRELEQVFRVPEAMLLDGPVRDRRRYAVLLKREALALQLIFGRGGIDTRASLPAQLCPPVQSTEASGCLADVGLVDAHRIAGGVTTGFAASASLAFARVLANTSS